MIRQIGHSRPKTLSSIGGCFFGYQLFIRWCYLLILQGSHSSLVSFPGAIRLLLTGKTGVEVALNRLKKIDFEIGDFTHFPTVLCQISEEILQYILNKSLMRIDLHGITKKTSIVQAVNSTVRLYISQRQFFDQRC